MNPKTLDDGREVIFRFAEKSDAKEILSYLKKVGSETDFLSFGFEDPIRVVLSTFAIFSDGKL